MARSNVDQPRIPKGFVGAGRFMKVGQALTAVKDAASPSGGGDRAPSLSGSTRGPRLANAGAKLSERQLERIDAKFSTAFDKPGERRAARKAASKPAAHPATPDGVVERHVRDVVASLTLDRDPVRGNHWVSLADVRDHLDGLDIPRDQQDRVLKGMRLASDGDVRIIAAANRKSLTERDRAGAIIFGEDDYHFIEIGANERTAASNERVAASARRAGRTPAPVRFEDMTEADLEREAQERRARQAANQAAQIERNGGQTDWERAMRLHNEEDIQSGEAEYRRADSKLDTEQRKLKAKRSELDQVEARIAALEASDAAGSARHGRFVDMRDFLREEVADLEMLVSSSRVRVEELRRGESTTTKPKRGALGGAAARLAGAGAKLSAPPVASGEVASRLRSASSVAQARDYLDGLKLSRPQLAQLARDLHVASYANANKTRLRDDIVAQIVGSRITHDAILRSSGG